MGRYLDLVRPRCAAVSTPSNHTHNTQNPSASPSKGSSADIAYENQIANETPDSRQNRQDGSPIAPLDISDATENEVDRLAAGDGWRPAAQIDPAIVSKIKRVEAEALRLGWNPARLWNFSFWPHTAKNPRGLASVMDPGDRVVEVTADCITIEKSTLRRSRLRFWRVDG